MNILVYTQVFPPIIGGIETFVKHICDVLHQQGHKVEVLTSAAPGDRAFDKALPYVVHRYPVLRFFQAVVPIFLTVFYTLRQCSHLIFVGHFMNDHAVGVVLLGKLFRVPYTILVHGNDLACAFGSRWLRDRLAARLLLDGASYVMTNSRYTKDQVFKFGWKRGQQIAVVNPGVDPIRFQPGVDVAAVRQKYALDGRRVLLTTARLVAKKNVDGVLRALPKVIERVPEVLYLIAGDGEERERLERLCDELRLRPYVRFLGGMENNQLPPLYCASDLFVMPSYEAAGDIETFGISFAEANACGLTVIGGRSGGIPDAVIDGETGLLVDPLNVDEIAEAIIRLLTDRDLSRSLGENGRRRVERELSWGMVGDKVAHILREVSRQGNARGHRQR